MKPIIEQYYDPATECQFVRLCLPMQYLVAVKRPRIHLFWQLVKICWAGCFMRATPVRGAGR